MNRTKYKFKLCVLFSICFLGLEAAEIINFDAESIRKSVYVSDVRVFSEATPILSSYQKPDYTGPTVYGGFQDGGGNTALLSGGGIADAGLKVRWNNGRGYPDDTLSGLFLFKRQDLINGQKLLPLHFEKESDHVRVEMGYMNPGYVGSEVAVKEASLRFVFKDSTGYHISASTAVHSKAVINFGVLSKTYYHYTPDVNTARSVGTIGHESRPSFREIEFVGFYLEAARGRDIAEGANIGIIKFTVDAKAGD